MAGFVIGRLENHEPVDFDALETDLGQNGELLVGNIARLPACQRVPHFAQIDATDPGLLQPCGFDQQVLNVIRSRFIVRVGENRPAIEDLASFQSGAPPYLCRAPALLRVLSLVMCHPAQCRAAFAASPGSVLA